MEYQKLGRSGLTVSRLCLGTMLFGGVTDEKTSKRICDMARDAGINFIDTADVYNFGTTEKVVARAIKRQRADWILAIKVGNQFDAEAHNKAGLTRRWIAHQLDASLKRLGTDHVDIFYFHREDLDTALEESVSAMGDAIRAGKVRYFGLSNFRAWRHAEVARLCDQIGVDRPIVSQPYYNAFNRTPENEVLKACEHYGMGVVPYSPVARGVLTGKYKPGEKPRKGTRAGRADVRMMQTEFREDSLRLAQTVVAHAEARGMTPAQFAVNWVLANPFITAAIAGPRTVAQMKDYLGTFAHQWTAEDEALIDSLVPQGHNSTHGFIDPGYTIEGRPVAY
jgi:aryl-alcohol dehydrogenase-like predicted oxidoreductase